VDETPRSSTKAWTEPGSGRAQWFGLVEPEAKVRRRGRQSGRALRVSCRPPERNAASGAVPSQATNFRRSKSPRRSTVTILEPSFTFQRLYIQPEVGRVDIICHSADEEASRSSVPGLARGRPASGPRVAPGPAAVEISVVSLDSHPLDAVHIMAMLDVETTAVLRGDADKPGNDTKTRSSMPYTPPPRPGSR
jgi:hypothetical protein